MTTNRPWVKSKHPLLTIQITILEKSYWSRKNSIVMTSSYYAILKRNYWS